jgi:redox-sensitive bicupin YhaK (pirin superfamily)
MSELELWQAVAMEEGDGARVRRLFPIPGHRNADPFVLCDEFDVRPPAAFPPHPHRGFEGVTYMIEGAFLHRDNLGNEGRVEAGGMQRFTAGSGLVHSETPGDPGANRGIQLWVNLAKADKGLAPSWQQIGPPEIPVIEQAGARIRVLCGPGAPLVLRTAVTYEDVALEPSAAVVRTVPADQQGFVYVLDGQASLNGAAVTAGQARPIRGGEQRLLAADGGARLILVAGRPHGEPIFQHGPYVD